MISVGRSRHAVVRSAASVAAE